MESCGMRFIPIRTMPPPAISCLIPCDFAPGLSLPYPSKRLMTPHAASPAPIAQTRVFNVVIAVVKKLICVYLYPFFFREREEKHCKNPTFCVRITIGFSIWKSDIDAAGTFIFDDGVSAVFFQSDHDFPPFTLRQLVGKLSVSWLHFINLHRIIRLQHKLRTQILFNIKAVLFVIV